MEIQEIKTRLTLANVLHHYGLKPDKNLRLNCPFHEDKTPSMQVYYKTHTAYCFSSNCKTHGKSLDVIDFIMYKENINKHEAIKQAESMISGNAPEYKPEETEAKALFLSKMFTYFKNAKHNSKPAQEYLKQRGLDYEILEIGYNSGQFHHGTRKDETLIQNCLKVGLLIDKNVMGRSGEKAYQVFGKHCIVFALRNRVNQITGLYFRSTIAVSEALEDTAKSARHYYLKDRSGLYPHYPKADTEKLILTEAIIDTASLLQIPEIANNYELLSCYGTNGLTKEHITAIKEWSSKGVDFRSSSRVEMKEIIFAFDNDEAGNKAVEKYASELRVMNENLLISKIELPCKDVNETLLAHQPEVFTHLIENRIFLFSNENQSIENKNTSLITPTLSNLQLSTLNCDNPYKLRYTTPTANYYIQGGISKILDSMKVTLVIEAHQSHSISPQSPQSLQSLQSPQSPQSLQSPQSHSISPQSLQSPQSHSISPQSPQSPQSRLASGVEPQSPQSHSISPQSTTKSRNKLDLYEDKQVEKLSKEVSEKLNLRKDLLEADIYKLTDLLDEYREKELSNSKSNEQAENNIIYPLTHQERQKVETFLKQEKLIYKLNELLGKSGIAGEETNRIFLLIIAISYKMPEPLHALIQGSSGSGKTRLLRQISDCIPSERVIRLTRVSDKGFYNYPEKYLKNKLVSLEDVDGLGEEATFAFRELQSNGELNSATSVKLENGQIVSGQKTVKGPIASLACTTQGEMYEDNMSRVFLIAVDESQEQTKRIIQYQNNKAAGQIDTRKEQEIKRFIQNVVRELKPSEVLNTFANKIQLPEEAHKIRRLNDLFQSFIKMITVINQYQRKRDEKGRLITQIEDIETAIDIMFESIVLKVDELDGSLRQFFEKLKKYVEKRSRDFEFSRFQVREATGLGKTQQHHYINKLLELEYIQQYGFANRGFKYKIVYWDDYSKLREQIKQHLQKQLQSLAFTTAEHQANTRNNSKQLLTNHL
ncbi:MAG: CHC2 zinc finger domain-containing protein [Bacteroidales bacterium]|nr:CHC2 zinc finger domain-containing protein [Bacteroidales bacterium]